MMMILIDALTVPHSGWDTSSFLGVSFSRWIVAKTASEKGYTVPAAGKIIFRNFTVNAEHRILADGERVIEYGPNRVNRLEQTLCTHELC